ncbi:hypothetical protein SDC9_201201 [bioreactor metagenome]|uniref:Uncharacterized protein n=1 Tax=bioreactor metagenome TaxID=1076179 RepID=A0A645IQL9_9ZZZZ
MLGDRRPNLSRIPVSRLLAAKNQVKIANRPDSLCQGIARCQHISPAQPPVREQESRVRPHHEGFADHSLCLRRPHGTHHHAPAVTFLQA